MNATTNVTKSAIKSDLALLSARKQKERTPLRIAWERFRRHQLAVVSGTIMLTLVLSAIFAPLLCPIGPYKTNYQAIRQPPSAEYRLGTDSAGRDVWSRLLYGGRVSLSVGLVAVAISLMIGIVLGAISGFYRGVVDDVLVRIAEAIRCFPRLIIIMTIVSVIGPSIWNIMLVIGLMAWTGTYRLVRAQVFSLREQDFILAARMSGAKNSRIIFRHALPNALSPVIVSATFQVAGALLMETSLGFLGMGVQPPTPTWGNMIVEAQKLAYLESKPWLWLPGVTLVGISVICINLIGDALRDAFDPHTLIR